MVPQPVFLKVLSRNATRCIYKFVRIHTPWWALLFTSRSAVFSAPHAAPKTLPGNIADAFAKSGSGDVS
jgi:hypothetical protein